jgi:hypothetical protein
MRKPSRIRRLVSLLLGCWLAVFAAEPRAIHVCPVHDVGAPAPHASHHSTPQHGHQSCSCPGTCSPGVGLRVPTVPAFAPARIVAFVEPDAAPSLLVRSADPQLLLPPAIGPPAYFG